MLQSPDAAERRRAAGVLTGAAVAVLALAVFVALAAAVARHRTAGVDAAVEAWMARHQTFAIAVTATVVSYCGLAGVMAVAVVIAALFYWRRAWLLLASALLVGPGAQGLDTLLKQVFRRPRPHLFYAGPQVAGDWSFPSGHATVSTAFCTWILLAVWPYLSRPGRVVVPVLLAALALAVGWSRLALDRHYLSDVGGGFFLGLFWAMVVWLGGTLLTLGRPVVPDPLDLQE